MNKRTSHTEVLNDARILGTGQHPPPRRGQENQAGCASLQNAKRNVLKGLANKLRAYDEGVEGWVEWPKLSTTERQAWLDRVACILQWDELNGGRTAKMHTVRAEVLHAAMQDALV